MKQPITITLEQLADALEAWERAWRGNPEDFLTAEEHAKAELHESSLSSATYLYSLLLTLAEGNPK